MKRMFYFFLFLILFSVGAFAKPSENAFVIADGDIVLSKVESDKKNILQGVFSSDDVGIIAEIEKILKDKAPELVVEMQNEPDNKKIIKYRSKLSELAFDEYEKAFVNMLEYRSRQTGRELKRDELVIGCEKHVHYWLDRGRLDTKECKGPDVSEVSAKEWVDWQTKNACFYPDGFEDHYIDITKYNCDLGKRKHEVLGILFISDDYKDKNASVKYTISLAAQTGIMESNDFSENNIELLLHVSNQAIDYDEYQKYRNQEIADIRAGMYEYDDEGTSSSGETSLYKIDYSKNWKSAEGPMTYIRSNLYLYNQSDQKYGTRKK